MIKNAILTMLFFIASTAGQAQQQVVWEKPSAYMGEYSPELEITRVELKQTETVLHICANYRPHSWISFAKESTLQTPDGKKYAITGGERTNENESDLQLDSLFYIPESGKAELALHFKPVPLDTKKLDFSEGDFDDAFRFWNICDSKNKKELVVPDEWQNVEYAKDEILPAAHINKGIATIKVRMLGYKPDMKLRLGIGGFTPLGSKNPFDKGIAFADDGTLKVEIPLWLAREVIVGVSGMSFPKIIIAPGQETSILMKVTSDHRPFLAFKGFLAKTNMDLVTAYNESSTDEANENTYLKVSKCQTPTERMQCLTDIFNQRIATIKARKYTTAAKDLLCMTAEENYIKWTREFAHNYSQYMADENGTVHRSGRYLKENYPKNQKLLPLSEDEKAYVWRYLNEPTSPCSAAFWNTDVSLYDRHAKEKNTYNTELRDIQNYLSAEDKHMADAIFKSITSEDCKAVVREYQAEQQHITQQLANLEGVYYKKLDEVTPENILQTILDKYKGKTVVIDIWATWCGPCHVGHKAMKPMKEEMKGRNIQFVYLTPPSSPLPTWLEMIKDIDGDHYYLTKEQYGYILSHYESNSIPTYAIYDEKGELTYKTIGFSGLDPIKEAIEKTLK